ncbi:MAG: hypothetical protein R2762_12900 [Bryobacteraceae bacterium]
MKHSFLVHFYLDPTTGSIAFQAAIGGAVAAFAAIRLYWRRAKRLFRIGAAKHEQ